MKHPGVGDVLGKRDMISERPDDMDLDRAEMGERRRRFVWAGLVSLFSFSIAVAIFV